MIFIKKYYLLENYKGPSFVFCQGLRNLQLFFWVSPNQTAMNSEKCFTYFTDTSKSSWILHLNTYILFEFKGHLSCACVLWIFWQQLENLGSAFSFNIAIKSLTHFSCIWPISYYNMYNFSMNDKANKVRKLSMGNAWKTLNIHLYRCREDIHLTQRQSSTHPFQP